MTPTQHFYLQLVSEILASLTPLLLGAFTLYLRARMKQQDFDRALKNEEIKSHLDAKGAPNVNVAVVTSEPSPTPEGQ